MGTKYNRRQLNYSPENESTICVKKFLRFQPDRTFTTAYDVEAYHTSVFTCQVMVNDKGMTKLFDERLVNFSKI